MVPEPAKKSRMDIFLLLKLFDKISFTIRLTGFEYWKGLSTLNIFFSNSYASSLVALISRPSIKDDKAFIELLLCRITRT